jgi:hypothetical protein
VISRGRMSWSQTGGVSGRVKCFWARLICGVGVGCAGDKLDEVR